MIDSGLNSAGHLASDCFRAHCRIPSDRFTRETYVCIKARCAAWNKPEYGHNLPDSRT